MSPLDWIGLDTFWSGWKGGINPTWSILSVASPASLVLYYIAPLCLLLFFLLPFTYHWGGFGSKDEEKRTSRQTPPPPLSPFNLPLLGDLIPTLWHHDRLCDWLHERYVARGEQTCRFDLPLTPTLFFTCSPANVEFVLKSGFDHFYKGPYLYSCFHDLLGNGIFNSDGHRWKTQRKAAANIFTTRNFKLYTQNVFSQEATHLLSILENHFSTRPQDPLDLQDLFFKLTLQAFGRIGFGIELSCLHVGEPLPFAAAFDRCQAVMHYRTLFPTWWFEERVGISGRHMKADVATIRSFAHEIIQHRRQELQESAVSEVGSEEEEEDEGINGLRGDLLTYFMRLHDEEGIPLSDETLCDYILNMIIAGRDTTAQAISWTFYCLDGHPEVEARLLDEVRQVTSQMEGTDEILGYEHIKQLKYAKAVFNESLRLYPSVPKEMKQAAQDTILPDGVFMAKGTIMAWSPYVMGRLESIWGPDAKQFRPERWLERSVQPTAWEYPVFNGGPRICLGRGLAELEGVYVMVHLLTKFRFRVVDRSLVTYGTSLTLPMRNGLFCVLERR